MFSCVLIIIYLAFISLGLPDPLLGSVWPIMHGELGVPLSYMGILSMIIAMGTVVSSFMTGVLVRKMGTGRLTAISVLLTAVAMFGFCTSDSFLMLCAWGIPYGLGAGAVDAALNNYVAVNYAAKHMSWLHCFWGVGTMASPYIMGYVLMQGQSWNHGYFAVAVLQVVLAMIIFGSIPKWKKDNASAEDEEMTTHLKMKEVLKIAGVPYMLMAFFCYCALEATAGMWASSYLCVYKGVAEERAATYAAMFYMGITFGRLVSGFVTDRLGDKRLIRIGLCILSGAIVLIAVERSGYVLSLVGIFLVGLGCAPIYPSLIHATPDCFGREVSASLVGMQLASAYLGVNLMPTLFGFLSDNLWNGLYPFYLMLFAILLIVMLECTLHIAEKKKHTVMK